MKWNLVYFDDEIQNIDCYKMFLADKFNVIGCPDARLYPQILKEVNPHAFLLDVHMPSMSGYRLYEMITDSPDYNGCPIIFISGDVSDEIKLKSHESGGMDFLTREMNVEEIEARLLSKIRLYLQTSRKLSLGNLVMDFESLKVFIKDNPVDLTLVELRILTCLLRHAPDDMTREDLLNKLWADENVKPGTINTHITNFKSKLKDWDYTILTRNEYVLIKEKNQ